MSGSTICKYSYCQILAAEKYRVLSLRNRDCSQCKDKRSSQEVQLHFGEVLNSRSNVVCRKDWIDFTVFEASQYSRRFKVFILVPASSKALRPAYLEVKLRSRYTNCLQVGRSAQPAPLNYLNLWATNSGSDKQPSDFRWKHENLLQLWGWLTHQGFSSVRWRGSFLKVKNVEAKALLKRGKGQKSSDRIVNYWWAAYTLPHWRKPIDDITRNYN